MSPTTCVRQLAVRPSLAACEDVGGESREGAQATRSCLTRAGAGGLALRRAREVRDETQAAGPLASVVCARHVKRREGGEEGG